MKVFRDRSIGKQGLLRTWQKDCLYHIWMFLLPMLLIACSGSLGKIQLENVNTVIAESEAAIEQAHRANAHYLASETLQQAVDALASAKEAVGVKDGLGAMHLAYKALTQAQIAEQEAMYKSQGNGLNAIIKHKEVQIGALEADLGTADEALEKSRTDVQRLEVQKDRLQANIAQKLQEAEQAHQKILQDYNKAKTARADLQSKLDTTETQLLQAQGQVEEHEGQIDQLHGELADAQSSVEEARKVAAEVRTQAAAQAQRYSNHIEQLDQSNVLKDTLARKKTGSTSLCSAAT